MLSRFAAGVGARVAAGVGASVAAGGRVRLVKFVEVIEPGPFFFFDRAAPEAKYCGGFVWADDDP
jgi:hypothetical protein